MIYAGWNIWCILVISLVCHIVMNLVTTDLDSMIGYPSSWSKDSDNHAIHHSSNDPHTHTGQKPQVYSEFSPVQRLQEITCAQAGNWEKPAAWSLSPYRIEQNAIFYFFGQRLMVYGAPKGCGRWGCQSTQRFHTYISAQDSHKQKNTKYTRKQVRRQTHEMNSVWPLLIELALTIYFFPGALLK